MSMSEDAEVFWLKLGSSGRSFYSNEYMDKQWQDIPLSVRRDISRAMNYQQGKINVRQHTTNEIVQPSIDPDAEYDIFDNDANIKDPESEYGNSTRAEYKSKGKLSILIFGMVAGAGGIIAGSILRKLLTDRGISRSRTDPAIQEALATTYRMHNRRLRLVSKGESITFIPLTDSTVDMQGGITNFNVYRTDDTDLIKIGEAVTFGSDHGKVVAISKNYAQVFTDEGKTLPVHIKALLRDDDIIYTKSTGMTTWNSISIIEKSAILKKCSLPQIYLNKHWDEVPQNARNVIQSEYGRDQPIHKAECNECDEGFKTSDDDEMADHKRSHTSNKDDGSGSDYRCTGHPEETFFSYEDAQTHCRRNSESEDNLRTKDAETNKYHYHRLGHDKDKVKPDYTQEEIEEGNEELERLQERQDLGEADKGKVKPAADRTDSIVGRQDVSSNGPAQDYQSSVKEGMATTSSDGMNNPVFGKPKKKSFEKQIIHGITQLNKSADGMCENCRCIVKGDADKCPECNAQYGNKHKMREETDLDKVAEEANENESEYDGKVKRKVPYGSPNNNSQQSSQTYEV